MDKKTYYINVGTGEVLEDKGALSFEFEISATEEEIDKLQELFEETDNSSATQLLGFLGKFITPMRPIRNTIII